MCVCVCVVMCITCVVYCALCTVTMVMLMMMTMMIATMRHKMITLSRANFGPSSPNYDDIFVNDAARQRLRINSARHWLDRTSGASGFPNADLADRPNSYTPILAAMARERLLSQVRPNEPCKNTH